jgi:hypothetical protein
MTILINYAVASLLNLLLFYVGLYHGATGTVVDIKFEDRVVVPDRYRLLPQSSTDGSMARQTFSGRPLPIVYVKMDNAKIDEELFPKRVVAIAQHKLPIFQRGEETVYR